MSSATKRHRAGFSLLELVIFIVVLGIGIAGTALLFNQVTRASVDPMIRKQTLALASSLLEEIELHAFTYCDPDEPAVYSATAATGAECGADATHVEGIGVESFAPIGVEDRYDNTKRFDNVNDYHNFRMGSGEVPPNADIRTADGTIITALSAYSIAVTVAQIGAGELGASVPAAEGLVITVTATHVPTATTVRLQGYRTRYAPNSP